MPIVIPSTAPTTTAQAIINRACDLFGYKDPSESLSSADSTAFLAVLNDMIDGWNTQRMFIPTVDEVVAIVSSSPVTIGPGATISITRPMQMEDGSYIRLDGADYPLNWISQFDYDRIVNKAQTGVLAYFGYYDPGVPVGSIYLWPQPSGQMELHLQLQTQLTAFADLTTTYSIAPGYSKAMAYTLAEELALGKRDVSPSLVRIAMNARRAIRRLNVVVPSLETEPSGGNPYANFIAGL